ncbi:MAG: hypothetical protein QGI33_06995 [Candidatus Brocadiia bacterium]|jgi:hypothetical protein|nr:hypothetical protein [Candidatus Brocadiia bacterium]
MNGFPMLKTGSFLAFIADNSALGIHHAGYNGLAALIPWSSGNNLFAPRFAGLNYEEIHFAGLPTYRSESGWPFEPRFEPMHIASADEQSVVLVQPEMSYSHVSARITFTVEEPHYLHQRIELTLHRRFCAQGEPNTMRCQWASYMHMPPDIHVYLKPDIERGGDLEGWVGVTRADHDLRPYQVRLLPSDTEIDAAEHLQAMQAQEPRIEESVVEALTFYYGLCHGDQLFLVMFKQPERFRLIYSPCGAGKEPAWNPAWDYLLYLYDAEIRTPYVWDLCLAVKPFEGRADALREVRRYLAS